MTKNEFLERLKELLCDLPQEECLEAIRYYEDYFADAGPEAEERVLRELGSPENVAEKIRAGYLQKDRPDEEDAFAENVFADRQTGDDAPFGSGMQNNGGESISGSVAFEDGGVVGNMKTEDAYAQGERMRRHEADAGRYENAGHYGQEGSYGNAGHYGRESTYGNADGYDREGTYKNTDGRHGYGATVRTKSYLSPVLVILAIVIGIPVLCPLFIAFSGLMLGFFIGFGVGGVCLIAGGITVLGNALADLSIGTGLVCVLSGGGLILTALGILFVVFAVNCAFRALPAVFRGIRSIYRRIFGRQEA